MEMMDSIRTFVLAMERGSLAAAGRHLGTSTASISRQISALETRLKVRLFNRGKRRLTPTEAGEMLLRRSLPLIDEFDQMIDSVSLMESTPRGLLRVNIRAITASRRLIPALPRFLRDNPDVSVDLFVSNDDKTDLIANNIDVDICYSRPESADLVAKLLAPSRLVLVASADYVAAAGPIDNVAALNAYDAIMFEPALGAYPWRFMAPDGPLETFEPRGRLRVNDGTSLRAAILAGLGMGMMPYHEIEEDIVSGQLSTLLPEYQIVHPLIGGEGIYAVYQSAAYQPGKLRSFLAFLPDVFSEGDA